jgi:hypothetical protein
MFTGDDGGLYERCDVCGLTVEVDDAEDARGWGINHYAMHEDRCPRITPTIP